MNKKLIASTTLIIIAFYLFFVMKINKITKVEIDVFSGRPNPSWKLSSEEASELIDLIDSFSAIEQVNLPEGKSGFRGFIISGLELNNHNSSNVIIVTNDIISVYYADGHRQDLHDKTKSVFNILQVMSSTHLEPDLYKVIFEN